MKERSPPDEPDPKAFERFKNLMRRLLGIPKSEVNALAQNVTKGRKKRGHS